MPPTVAIGCLGTVIVLAVLLCVVMTVLPLTVLYNKYAATSCDAINCVYNDSDSTVLNCAGTYCADMHCAGMHWH